jgi:hypothetical protein
MLNVPRLGVFLHNRCKFNHKLCGWYFLAILQLVFRSNLSRFTYQQSENKYRLLRVKHSPIIAIFKPRLILFYLLPTSAYQLVQKFCQSQEPNSAIKICITCNLVPFRYIRSRYAWKSARFSYLP